VNDHIAGEWTKIIVWGNGVRYWIDSFCVMEREMALATERGDLLFQKPKVPGGWNIAPCTFVDSAEMVHEGEKNELLDRMNPLCLTFIVVVTLLGVWS
jgi:hypothetical protein